MSVMTVIGIKITKEPVHTKVAYKKNGKVFVRTGDDDFAVGTQLQGPDTALFNHFGYRKVENPPSFHTGKELLDNILRFSMSPTGKVSYQ